MKDASRILHLQARDPSLHLRAAPGPESEKSFETATPAGFFRCRPVELLIGGDLVGCQIAFTPRQGGLLLGEGCCLLLQLERARRVRLFGIALFGGLLYVRLLGRCECPKGFELVQLAEQLLDLVRA